MAIRRPLRKNLHADEALVKGPHADFMQEARDRFQLGSDASQKQRERELEDLRFYNGDQWPADLRESRQGQVTIANMPPIPARPCITINQALQPVAQILNQERAMDMGVELVPADDFEGLVGPIDPQEIELREGLLRRTQRAPETAEARTWAFERAAVAGIGYWGVMTKYVTVAIPEKDAPPAAKPLNAGAFDKDLFVQKFFNQSSVTVDPFHESSTGEDMEWAFVGSDVPWDRYKAEFPQDVDGKDNDILDYSDDDFRALGDTYPGWFTISGKDKLCRVVDYYYTVRETRTLCLMPDGTALWKDELPEGSPKPLDTRDVTEKRIKWAKIDGSKPLSKTDWEGPDIPIVKVVGRELQPTDDDRRTEGIVRPMRESGQGLNYMVSKGVEQIGLAPIPTWQIAAGQDEGFENEYILATTRTLPSLHYNTHDGNGVPYATIPTRTDGDSKNIQPIWMAIELFKNAIHDTSLTPSTSLGEIDPSIKSGKAIKQLLDQAQKGTSNFLDNQSRSIRREGQILNGLLYPIYGARPGRLARIMTGEGESQTIIVGQPMVMAGPEGQQRPQPAQPNDPSAKHYQLTPNANFNMVVKVSKSYDTRREQEAALLGDLISANPAEMTVVGDLFFKNLDGPGHDEMAERHKLMLDPKVLQYLDEKKQGQTPTSPLIMAKMAQAQQQIQLLTAELQKAQMGIPKAQIDAQARTDQSAQKTASDERMASMEHQNNLLLEQIRQQNDNFRALIALQAKGVLEGQQQGAQLEQIAHQTTADLMLQHHQGAVDSALADQKAGHQMAASAQQADQQAAASDQQAGNTMAVNEHQQAIQPPPPEPQGGAQ